MVAMPCATILRQPFHMAMALSRGPDRRCAAPVHCGGDHTRKTHPAAAQELPYAATVETSDWKRLKDGSVRIEQTIYVERESQRKIVLGKGGRAVKKISMEARTEIADLVESPVHLFLFVKVRERWGDDPERYREMGLDFPTG